MGQSHEVEFCFIVVILLGRVVIGFDLKTTSEDLSTSEKLEIISEIDLPSSCKELNWGSVFTDEAIIKKIEDMLPDFETKGLEPAIPIYDLKRYQNLPLSDCLIQDGEFKFQVEVPAKSKNQDFQLYNFPKGSFSFETENGICYFDYPTKGIVETSAGNSIFPLSEEQWEHCTETSICQIPISTIDENYGDYACLRAMFSGKIGKELAPYCKFHCHPYPSVIAAPENSKKEISESFFFSWILK